MFCCSTMALSCKLKLLGTRCLTDSNHTVTTRHSSLGSFSCAASSPKARIERWDTLACLNEAKRAAHWSQKRKQAMGPTLIALASQGCSWSLNKSSIREVSDMKKVLSADVLGPIWLICVWMRLIKWSWSPSLVKMRVSIVAYRPVGEVKFENGVLYYNDQIVEEGSLDFESRSKRKLRRASF